ncbi:metalloregulator ArsR/SmtB family transcription factor [uncultured Brevundimonas sp.]|uniref:ArsR/SmtB family transcription factor n=1 Tax=uncultured Brevundimonas sp. TaxID=213418 RepID=UPI0030EF0147|tara:strand:- start:2792 stop:3115 length:324 start_codon:yes stop_codon:yes gene_type:complete
MSNGEDLNNVFKALANPVRRRLLDAMKDGPRTTGQLCEAERSLDRCTVMQHLKILETADLILVRREGRERWNHLNAMPIKAVHDRWIAPYARQAVTMLEDLKARAEG